MNKPMPVKGNRTIIDEQQRTIREQVVAIRELHDDRAKLVNLIARVLDDYLHHACVTDETLRALATAHSKAMGEDA